METLKNIFEGKKILVTGGAGSIGSEIVRQLLHLGPDVVRILDNNETAQFYLSHELQDHAEHVRFLIGDVRDLERMKTAMEDIDIVFHAAALKHVPLCEYNPFEAVMTNTMGTQNIIKAAMMSNVDKVVVISTDKAANPVNTMGATKLLAEKLAIASNQTKGRRRTKLSCVRFGNVVGSNGSVIHVFKEQIQRKRAVTITEPAMMRFMMSIQDAILLVLKTVEQMQGGEIFILKRPVFNLQDFAEVIIEEVAPRHGLKPEEVEITKVGARPGEKISEDLMTEDEAKNALETSEMFIVMPHKTFDIVIDRKKYIGTYPCTLKNYTSLNSRRLSKKEIREMLREAKVL